MLNRCGRRPVLRAPVDAGAGGQDLQTSLFRALEARLAQTPLGCARVLLLGFEPGEIAALRKLVRLAGSRTTAAAASTRALCDDAAIAHFSHVFVSLDSVCDLGAAVDALIAHRARHPKQIVFLCDRGFGTDDLGTERAPIADASLRLPVSLPRFMRALFAAGANAVARAGSNRQSVSGERGAK